jgi:hypothetical protein
MLAAPAVEIDCAFRARISDAVCRVLRPVPEVLAGWEGGSAAFGALDAYSDIDLNYLVADTADVDRLYRLAEHALATVSPIVASHPSPPGRYYQLKDAGEFLLVDLIIMRTDAPEQFLGTERHGHAVPLFDKGLVAFEAPGSASPRHKADRAIPDTPDVVPDKPGICVEGHSTRAPR